MMRFLGCGVTGLDTADFLVLLRERPGRDFAIKLILWLYEVKRSIIVGTLGLLGEVRQVGLFPPWLSQEDGLFDRIRPLDR